MTGKRGAGAVWLVDRIDGVDGDLEWGDRPASLAAYVALLKQTARHWRRGWQARRRS